MAAEINDWSFEIRTGLDIFIGLTKRIFFPVIWRGIFVFFDPFKVKY